MNGSRQILRKSGTQTGICSLLVILPESEGRAAAILSIQVFVLILIYYGSSPLVHLLIQSSHWVTATAHYCFKQSSPGLAGLGYFWDLVRFHWAHTGGERGKGCCWPLWKARWDGENYKPFKSVLNRNIKSLERAMKATRQNAMYL